MSDNSTETLNDSNDRKLDQILTALQDVRTRLAQVEAKVDERLRETRPIWEAVTTQLAELKEVVLAEGESRQAQIAELRGSVHAEIAELRDSVHAQYVLYAELKESLEAQISELKVSQQSFRAEVEKSFRQLDRRMEMYSEMVSRVHAYERDLEDRVDELAKRLA